MIGHSFVRRAPAIAWLFGFLSIAGAAEARTLDMARRDAIVWLESQQNPDGSWGEGRLQGVATAEALYALVAVGRRDTVVVRRAVSWLQHRVHESVDSAARALRALTAAGVDVQAEAFSLPSLSAVYAHPSGSNRRGWGPTPPPLAGAPPDTNSYDTALAVGALREAGLDTQFPVSQAVAEAVALLGDRQNLAFSFLCGANVGGWSGDLVPFLGGDFNDLTVTAEILRSLGSLTGSLVTAGVPSGGFARSALAHSCIPVSAGTSDLEVAARIVGWFASDPGAGAAPALQSALLDDGRFEAAGVWSDDPLVNAMGLLAVHHLDPSWSLSPTGDEDADGVLNGADAFPYDDAEQADADSDGIGDNADRDKDGDGVLDAGWGGPDAFPGDPTRAWDADGNGVADAGQLTPAGDADGDGLPDHAELAAGTDPFSADTDGDGTADGVDPCPEVAAGTDEDGDGVCTPDDECDDPQVHPDAPLLTRSVGGRCDAIDADGDGFDDALEIALGSDPWDASDTPAAAPSGDPGADFDGDGIANGDELLRGTSPLLADTDGDGVLDPEDDALADALDPFAAPRPAIAVFGAGSTDPSPGLVGATASASVTLGQPTPVAAAGGSGAPPESMAIRDAVGFQPQTLLARDLDGDGLAGWAETGVASSHRAVDTDGDGFADGVGGVVVLTGSGLEWDLDGDGFLDGEADLGTDPADASDRPGRPGDVAPAGSPDGRVNGGDAVLMLRLAADPDGILDAVELAGPNGPQNRAITEQAADALAPPDGQIRADDAVHVLRQAAEGTP